MKSGKIVNIPYKAMGVLIYDLATDWSNEFFFQKEELGINCNPVSLLLNSYIYIFYFTRITLLRKYGFNIVNKIMEIAYDCFYNLCSETLSKEEVRCLKETAPMKQKELEELIKSANPLKSFAKQFYSDILYSDEEQNGEDINMMLNITLEIGSWIKFSEFLITDYNIIY